MSADPSGTAPTGIQPRGAGARPTAVSICEIRWWRGYRRSTFFAVLDDGTAVAESPPFRSRDEPPARTGEALAAHESLVATLQKLGWTAHQAPSDVWFADRFARELEWPSGAKEPPPEPAAPPPSVPDTAPANAEHAPPAPPAPKPTPKPVERPRRRKRFFLAIVALIVVAISGAVASAALLLQDRRAAHPRSTTVKRTVTVERTVTVQHAVTVTVERRAAAPVTRAPKKVSRARTPVRATKAAATPLLTRLAIRATGRASWLEVRRTTRVGSVLFSGLLAPQKRLQFAAHSLWARFAAAGDLEVTQDGKRVPLVGTIERVFTARSAG